MEIRAVTLRNEFRAKYPDWVQPLRVDTLAAGKEWSWKVRYYEKYR